MSSRLVLVQGTDDIVKSALQLPETERAEVARRILETLDEGFATDVEDEWAREVARRLQDLESGRAETMPASEALARARKRLRH